MASLLGHDLPQAAGYPPLIAIIAFNLKRFNPIIAFKISIDGSRAAY
jgi:hypothetical protein